MKPGNILALNKIKIYFPFFMGKDRRVCSLLTEGDWLVSYLLLCDTVVLPPRAFLFKDIMQDNFEIISRSKLLKHLFETGQIVTASTKPSIRDIKDLLEYYHPKESPSKLDFDLFVYDRDEFYQRRLYSEHLKDRISSVQYYGESEKEALTKFLNTRPNHPAVLEKFRSLSSDIERPALERLRLEAMNAYFLGGAMGNNAIMPPSQDKERSLIYNPFYSKGSIQHFKSRIEDEISMNILSCPPKVFETIKSNLLLFRFKYFELSEKYQNNYFQVSKLLTKNKVYVDLPLVAVYAAAATTIASILSIVISKAILMTLGAVFVAEFLWKSISKVLGITDKLSKSIEALLKNAGIFSPYRREVSSLLGEFESAVKSVMMR